MSLASLIQLTCSEPYSHSVLQPQAYAFLSMRFRSQDFERISSFHACLLSLHFSSFNYTNSSFHGPRTFLSLDPRDMKHLLALFLKTNRHVLSLAVTCSEMKNYRSMLYAQKNLKCTHN